MAKRFLLPVVALIVVTVGISKYFSPIVSLDQSKIQPNLESPFNANSSQSIQSTATVIGPLPKTALASRPLKEPQMKKSGDAPTFQILKSEVSANPHATPFSMMKFSRELGSDLRAAYQSDAAARELLSKVATCVKGNTTSSIQAVCLVAARELARHRKEYKLEVQNLMASASKSAFERASWITPGSKK